VTPRTIVIARVLLGLAIVFVSKSPSAHEIEAGAIVIEHPWARATAPVQKTGAAYMRIRNQGTEPERLLAAQTVEAQSAELHNSTITPEGVARMRPVETLEIPPGGEAKLAPGGLHLMLVELRGQLFEGTMFPMTLVFERAGEVEIEVEVTAGGGDGAHQGTAH
jgi:copper(I)-binding protein